MKLITKKIYQQLRKNNELFISNGDDGTKLKPVVKLFTPDAQATWLLLSIDENNIAFGLCDLGMGYPELGYISLDELQKVRGRLGLPVERDMHFYADKTLEQYARLAQIQGKITT